MKNDIRNSGIDIIGDVPWGMHFCQFYQTKEDLMDIVIPYLKAGLENKELCVWITSQSLEDAKTGLRNAIPDFDIYLEKRQIEIISCADWYIKEGAFDSQKAISSLADKVNQSLASGYDGLRFVENICRLEKESRNSFVSYERRLDSITGRYPVIALCTYSLDTFSATDIIDIVANHQFILSRKNGEWEKTENTGRKITAECKQAEEALQKSEERYCMLFTHMTDGFGLVEVIYTDSGKPYDYRYLEVNPAFGQYLGLERKQMLGRTMLEIFPNVSPTALEKYHKTAVSSQSVHFEIFSHVANKYLDIYAFSPEKGKLALILRDITERKRIEKELQESEERFEVAFRTIPDALVISDTTTGLIVDINNAWTCHWGYSREESIGRRSTELGIYVNPADRERCMQILGKGGLLHEFDIELRTKKGDLRQAVISTEVLKIQGGQLMLTVIRDITERKQAEEALQQSRNTLHAIIDTAPAAIVVAQTDGKIILTNPNTQRILGGSVTGNAHGPEGSYKITMPDGSPVPAGKLPLSLALKGQTVTDTELLIVRDDGAQAVILASATPLQKNHGKPWGAVAVLQDITERKKAEEALRHAYEEIKMQSEKLHAQAEELRKSNEALCENEARLQVIIANSPDIIFEQDRDLRYTWIYNPSSPYSISDVLGKTDSDLVPPDQANKLESIKHRVLNTGKHEKALLQLSPGGEPRWFEATYEPRYDEAGQVTGVLSYTRDVTESKKMEKELQESERQSRELAQSIEVERARLAAILENLPVGVWIADTNGHLTGKNREADRIWAGEAPLLKDIDEYAEYTAWYADSGKLLTSGEYPVARALLTGQPVEPIELRIRRFDGTEGVVLVSAVPIKDRQGRLMGAVGINLDITRLKQTERELQESEENYRNIVETATEGIWIGDTEARTVYVNKRLTEMLGYTQEEMIDKFAWDFADEDEKSVVKKNIGRRRKGIDERYEFKFIRKDGSPLWSIVSSKSLFDKAGKFAGSMSLLTDITTRKEAESKLKETLDNLEEKVKERTMQLEKAYKSLEESEKSLAEAQRIARIGNWNWNALTNRIYLSDEAYRIFGLKPQEFKMTFSKFLSYIHPDDREYANNAIKKALAGESYSIDFRIILTGGEERVVHAQGEAIPGEKSTPPPIRGTIQDITERKRAEDRLRSSEERYRSFIENFKGIAFQADENFIPVFMHGTVEEITGYSEKEFMSKQRWKNIIHPEDLPIIYEEEEKVRSSTYKASGEIDFRIIRKDGKTKWVHEIYQKIPGKNGEPDRYQGAIYDITERKEAEETLAKIDRIRIKEIHHRIKNNLQVISSLLDLQAETFSQLETCKTPEVVEAFMESQRRVISMALIHEELYKGDKIDTLDFAAYLRKLTEDLFSSYNLGNEDISFKLDLKRVDLSMDTAIPLGIVVNELVSNSFKHAFPARGIGEIRINLQRSDNSASTSEISASEEECIQKNSFPYLLTVSDNGNGIQEELDFENSDSLGLQLVNILVEQIDGCIKLERNQGTKFTILFSDLEM